MSISVAVMAIALAVLAVSDIAAGRQSSHKAAEPSGLLVFQGLADGDSEIYLVRSSGGRPKQLTRNGGERPGSDDVRPVWSPDGRRIIWSRNRWLYVMNADGSGKWRLPNSGDVEYSWAPDGQRLVFGSRGDLYVINANGRGLRRLTRNLKRGSLDISGGSNETLQWAPTGQWIAFVRRGLYVIRPDGTGLRRVLPDEDFWPFIWRWSPDGRRIAVVDSDYGTQDPIHRIGVVKADGTGLTWFGRSEWTFFDWSPDSRQLALFCGSNPASADICVINADGSGSRNLTNTPEQDEWEPAWSPDTRRIAFGVARRGIYVLNPSTGGLSRITVRFGHPLWSPGGRWIAFKQGGRGHGSIYVVGEDGRAPTLVARRALNQAWQPKPRQN